uniref:C-type lectin domain family 12 member B isoform X4 n=1 Tax=Scatophagus argus TaxID=75038 RepID=UPI001ED846A9|nr:C-type lectin domain family 12 member B isoform X4 [Scatophagus argus]XP_046256424.1 C-type lectin domain family 12 member B isoform X5 [Scatophagus argus]XP_046256425.1 C-type lectin domain family 12 member B isoform X6 [Scatophagus argus]
MAEAEEVNYASVVFKNNQQAGAKKNEETVYDEVKVRTETTKQNVDTNGLLTDKKADVNRRHRWLACFFGILCILLLVAIIAVCVYFTTLSEKSEEKQLRENQTTLLAAVQNLNNLNHKLMSDSENLAREHNNLTVLFDNLNQSYAALESKVSNLTAEIQELKTQRNNLTETIQDMETQWTESNVSRAQWSIDAYCPKVKGGVSVRKCNSCQSGWTSFQSSCYAINNAKLNNQKTWAEAQANCRQKVSHLAVISNNTEKAFVINHSWDGLGYWIGLRVEEGKWKWVDGRDLTEDFWKPQQQQPPTEGHCAVSFEKGGLKSANCTERYGWVCQKEGLSV